MDLDETAGGRTDFVVCTPDATALAAARDLGLVGCSEAHRTALSRLSKVAPTGVEVLITGPSGTGKDLYAQYCHRCGARRAGNAFIAVNCGAVPDALFENELFGHGAGAYTGAARNADGLVATAEGGTLFLDEVDTLAPGAQVKLLRFLEQREYRRLGEARVRRSNVAVIAATNADLEGRVRAGRFREDLFFRLRVVSVDVPPLRLRREDVPLLLNASVQRAALRYGLPAVEFGPRAAERLLCYGWPGNVRELENLVRSLTCQQLGRPVEIGDLPLLDDRRVWSTPPDVPARDALPLASRADGDAVPAIPHAPAGGGAASFQEAKHQAVNEFERDFVRNALRDARGNIAAAARVARKHRRAFLELMRKHDIAAAPFKTPGGTGTAAPLPARPRPGTGAEPWDEPSSSPDNGGAPRQAAHLDRH